MRSILKLLAALFLFVNAATAAVVEMPASVKTNTIWPSPVIGVCWENPLPEFAQERVWVRDAIAQSWSLHSALTFTGWDKCPPSSGGGQNIRIWVSDAGAHTKGLGRDLDGKPQGMLLNFTFAAWNQACAQRRESCIRSIAIHEFGHAIGFSHEQNRPDSPAWCHPQSQGTPGDWHVTDFDLESIMNYCNPSYNNNGQLSAKDIQGVKFIYPRLAESTVDPSTWFRIISRKSEQCIHVQNANGNRRNEMWQWPCQETEEFKFRFERLGDGYVRIRSAYNQCFHVRTDVNQARRAALWQWECQDSDEFKFKLLSTGDGWYVIKAKAGMCFHVRNGPTTAAREPLWSWECVNQPEFYFRLERAAF